MGKDYNWNNNPFQDFLFGSIMNGVDIADKEVETEIFMSFFTILEYYVPEKSENQHLDYDIKKRNGRFKVVANNSITALWLSGIFPENSQQVLDDNKYIDKYDGETTEYKFNAKTKKLTYKSIK